MAYKIFLDTNIYLDLLMHREFELEAVHEIVKLAEKGIIDLYISESIITNIFYILRKEKGIDVLSALRELLKVVNVIPFSKDILYHSLEKYKDTEDGILYFIAVKAKMNYFLTRNVKDFSFVFPSLPVMTPNTFLKDIYFVNDLPQ